MSSVTMGTHSGAGPLGLMSCVRESSPLQDFDSDTEKSVATKKRFWNPKKWFKRKQKGSDDVQSEVTDVHSKDTLRSRSASELSIADEQIRKRSSSSMHPGLSVSHDSVFHSPHSGSENDLDAAQSSSSLSISQPQADLRLQTELTERLRLRRTRGDKSEEDEGLPGSPCNSPATTDGLLDKTANKDLPTKSHSTCSDGSLLSMGSSEMDEDSFGQQSRHSSKLSLHDKKSIDQDSELDLSSPTAPLNHSAAHHKVSVRPKRTHGAPRRNHRVHQLATALPSTPEVNEEVSLRHMSPGVMTHSESVTEQYSMSTKKTLTDSQLKCSSLPPGVAPPNSENKLNRSRSNAGSKDGEKFTVAEEEQRETKKSSISIFERIMPRRSGKKKKLKEEKIVTKEAERQFDSNVTLTTVQSNSLSEHSRHTVDSSTTSYNSVHLSKRIESKPVAAPRSGPATRQRIQPINIPASPEAAKREPDLIQPKPSPEKAILSSSPLQMELESHFKHHRLSSSSPPKSRELPTPPISPKSPKTTVSPISPVKPTEQFHFTKSSTVVSSSRYVEAKRESRFEEIKSTSKIKIAGLSSLQEKIMSLNDDEMDNVGFKSLTETATESSKVKKPIVKSHSFKSTKPTEQTDNKYSYTNVTSEETRKHTKDRNSFIKAASLDSIKNLEDNPISNEIKKSDIPTASMKKLIEKQNLTDFIISETQQAIIKNHRKDINNEIIKSESIDLLNEPKVVDLMVSPKIIPEPIPENNNLSKSLYEWKQSNFKVESNNNSETKFESKINPITIKTSSRKNSVDNLEEKKDDGITISGPSHTAVVNISNVSSKSNFSMTNSTKETIKKEVVEAENNNVKEQKVSITNIQLKREVLSTSSQESTTVPKTQIPEFINRQLNKVETKPTSTVVCSINSPRILDEQSRPKTLPFFEPDNNTMKSLLPSPEQISSFNVVNKPPPRKFSKENIEIIDKDVEEELITTKPLVMISSMTPPIRYRKNESTKRNSSIISITPEASKKEVYLKNRSTSLDSLRSDLESSDKSSQDSLDKLEEKSDDSSNSSNNAVKINDVILKKNSPVSETNTPKLEVVVPRKKSIVLSKRSDDQPELMKVFARRSLKLKDTDAELLSQQVAVMTETEITKDSDKENHTDSPKERKKSVTKEIVKPPLSEITEKKKSVSKETFKMSEVTKTTEIIKTSSIQRSSDIQKTVEETINNKETSSNNTDKVLILETKKKDVVEESDNEVVLRNPLNNKFAQFQRTVSLQPNKGNDVSNLVKKQQSFHDRRKTDHWLTNIKNEESEKASEISQTCEIISEELITESKNFNQRKAIWEKRAQEGQKKSVP